MNEQINQKDINNAAWAACDTFRGVVDPAQYKDYILTTLFIKYISDVWKDHHEELRKEHGNDEALIRRLLKLKGFTLPEVKLRTKDGKITDKFPATYDELYKRRNLPNIGELFNIVLEHIEENNKSELGGVFRNIDFNSEANLGQTKDRNLRLKRLLEDFHKPHLDMRPSRVSEDIIGNTYIYLIERFASAAGKKAGEFYTPSPVTKIIAKLASPKPGNRIHDPACGSGGLLIQTAQEINDKNFALYGQEVNGSTWALCRMNMFLHRHNSARIEWGDTLNNPLLTENNALMKFECVVSNPPFSLDKWGAENAENDQYNRYWRGIPPKSKADWAFITHMIESAITKEGRVSVVVPHGVLFRGAAEGRIRRSIIEENLLDAVIGLPGNLFPSTSIPVAILTFDRAREKGGKRAKCKDILFIDASRDYIAGTNQNTLGKTQIDKIVQTHKARQAVEKYAALASLDDIRENDYNLNIPRYVDTFEEEETVDIDAVQREIEELEEQLAAVRKEMAAKLAQLRKPFSPSGKNGGKAKKAKR